ncbi:hypothetical protein B0T22DRAFT_479889 [Podospora appendiculata]|uniref:Uncharacterized protein n=1 Tax=Podospora appendiculata TaxID=314037 RepID=A0AAE0XA11_9PEZI|nr:hypothetical protein B0T22DRAFT_479889 [Podospora appendiculata]
MTHIANSNAEIARPEEAAGIRTQSGQGTSKIPGTQSPIAITDAKPRPPASSKASGPSGTEALPVPPPHIRAARDQGVDQSVGLVTRLPALRLDEHRQVQAGAAVVRELPGPDRLLVLLQGRRHPRCAVTLTAEELDDKMCEWAAQTDSVATARVVVVTAYTTIASRWLKVTKVDHQNSRWVGRWVLDQCVRRRAALKTERREARDHVHRETHRCKHVPGGGEPAGSRLWSSRAPASIPTPPGREGAALATSATGFPAVALPSASQLAPAWRLRRGPFTPRRAVYPAAWPGSQRSGLLSDLRRSLAPGLRLASRAPSPAQSAYDAAPDITARAALLDPPICAAAPRTSLGRCANLWRETLATLRQMCEERDLAVFSSLRPNRDPVKSDYIAALFCHDLGIEPREWARVRTFTTFFVHQTLRRMRDIVLDDFEIDPPRPIDAGVEACNVLLPLLARGRPIPPRQQAPVRPDVVEMLRRVLLVVQLTEREPPRPREEPPRRSEAEGDDIDDWDD